ncbi:Sil1 like protein [Phytophthora palmivora]|uniref:Sil1 like protein n=1 Tax=Phytophthora palmivora TaxID=4796 RepID=A0A2P4XLZ9_9STRA|nr:Sil1 like protein [Phytophthora palmivora]
MQIEKAGADNSCDVSNDQRCQRKLQERHQVLPEFVPTNEWQDILPNQAIPPVLHLLANTPLLAAARVRANFNEQASGKRTTLVPVPRKRAAVLTDSGPTNAVAPPMFEPTHTWKEILPNQVLPAGLHIRVNLQTGKKEAKLLD